MSLRRLELFAKAKGQSSDTDLGALVAQIEAVDAASAEQELEGVPPLEYKSQKSGKRYKKSNKKKQRRRGEATAVGAPGGAMSSTRTAS